MGYVIKTDGGKTAQRIQARDLTAVDPATRPSSDATPTDVLIGTRVLIKALGWGGSTGTVTKMTRFGYTVATDDGKTARALQAKDLRVI